MELGILRVAKSSGEGRKKIIKKTSLLYHLMICLAITNADSDHNSDRHHAAPAPNCPNLVRMSTELKVAAPARSASVVGERNPGVRHQSWVSFKVGHFELFCHPRPPSVIQECVKVGISRG